MTLGTALIIIAVLYLIDRHKLWKRCAQGTMVLAIVGALVAVVAGTMSAANRDRTIVKERMRTQKVEACYRQYEATHPQAAPLDELGACIVDE